MDECKPLTGGIHYEPTGRRSGGATAVLPTISSQHWSHSKMSEILGFLREVPLLQRRDGAT